jgi:hypothetical protein
MGIGQRYGPRVGAHRRQGRKPALRSRDAAPELRRCWRRKDPQIHAFDKQTGKTFCTAIKKVLAERAFYDFPDAAGTLSLEPAFAELEAKAAPAF